jgi:hypothetical protein
VAPAILPALLLVGCAEAGSKATQSPFYREGFDDGCATASAQGTPGQTKPVRDQALFDRDKDYHAGWISGLAQCRMSRPQIP